MAPPRHARSPTRRVRRAGPSGPPSPSRGHESEQASRPRPLLGLAAACALLGGLVLLFASGGVLAEPEQPIPESAGDGNGQAETAQQQTQEGNEPGPALVLDMDGAIGPATTHMVRQAIEKAEERSASILILRLDTPGGLVTSTRDLVRSILASPVPIAVYVSPSGAQAASAGTFILYSSHVAAMAPGTNVGAATPVQMGHVSNEQERPASPRERLFDWIRGGEQESEEDPEPEPQRESPEAQEQKAIEDAVAFIKSLAELRGRSKEWAEEAVRGSASATYTEALEKGVIEFVASDVNSLLEQADGMKVLIGEDDEKKTLRLAGATVEQIKPDWRVQLLAVLANPMTAFILMMLGIYGLILEFSNPGAIYPGVIGAICLILALFALNLLPLNYAALGLLLLGIAMMVGEAFSPSFGVLGIGGVIAFALGAIWLFDTDVPEFRLGAPVITVMTAASAGIFIFLVSTLWKSQRRPIAAGREQLVGTTADVLDWNAETGRGRIRVQGELWQAASDQPIEPGSRVRVLEAPGLTLRVEPLSSATDTPREGTSPDGT